MIMSRNTVNFILDVVSFLNMLGLIFTGVIMKYALPPGSGRGINAKVLWSLKRHDWGNFHFYLSVVFIVLMIIHVILHWTWVKHSAASFCRRGSLKQSAQRN